MKINRMMLFCNLFMGRPSYNIYAVMVNIIRNNSTHHGS